MRTSYSATSWGSLLAWILCAAGCDRVEPLAPNIEAAAARGGSSLKSPSNASAIGVSADRVDVSWRDNTSNESGFEVWRSPTGAEGTFAPVASRGANVVAYSDAGPGVDPTTAYCYRVRAFRLFSGRMTFSGFSNTACAPVGDVRVTAASSGVDLDADGYIVALDAVTPTGLRSVAAATVAANGTVVFSGLRAGNHYRVSLGGVYLNCQLQNSNPQPVVVVGGGVSNATFSVACSELAPPASPSMLTFAGYVQVGISNVVLSWQNNATLVEGIRIERCDLAMCGDGDFSVVAVVSRWDTWYVDYYLWDGATYTYRVRAFNRAGDSAPSNEVAATACVVGISEDGTYVCG